MEKSGGVQREIVAMNEQPQTNLVHPIRLRERQSFSDEARQPLPQCVVPPLDMSGEAAVFAARRMLRCRDDVAISLPEIRVAVRRAIGCRDALPELTASRFRAVADDISHDLARAPRERDPNPALAALLAHKRPEFVQFQLCGRRVIRCWLNQCRAQVGELSRFFLSQTLTVLRETPKTRSSPRKLLRSSYALRMRSFSASG